MNHSEFEDLCPIYALGALDGEDLKRFDEHLSSCDACSTQLGEFEEVSASIALSLRPIAPSPEVRGRLLNRVEGIRRRASPVVPMAWALAAAVMFAVALGLLWQRAKHGAEDLEAKLTDQLEQAKSELARLQKLDRLLRDPDARVSALQAGKPAPAASGRVVWKGKELAFVANGLPTLPTDKEYELWALRKDQKPLRAGEYRIDATGGVTGLHTFAVEPASVIGFAVTLEPKGGNESPTSDLYLVTK